MAGKTTTLQIRIDEKTKREAKKIFEQTGLDMSSAIKLFLKQTINFKTFPIGELRDENGLSLQYVLQLKKEIEDVTTNKNKKRFVNGEEVVNYLVKK
jgi:DNA-damage-inducible protein J